MPRYKIAVEFTVEVDRANDAEGSLDCLLNVALDHDVNRRLKNWEMGKPVEIVEMPDPESAVYQKGYALARKMIEEFSSDSRLQVAHGIIRANRDPKTQADWGKIAAANAYIQEQQRQALGIDHQAEAQRRETW